MIVHQPQTNYAYVYQNKIQNETQYSNEKTSTNTMPALMLCNIHIHTNHTQYTLSNTFDNVSMVYYYNAVNACTRHGQTTKLDSTLSLPIQFTPL